MYSRGNSLGLSTPRHEDYPLAAAVGLFVAAYLGVFVGLFRLMQPTVTATPGLAAYQPPPKTIVRYADSPWVPPPPSDVLPIRKAAEPAPAIAKSSVAEEPKKETKKQEARTSPRRARPSRDQHPNPFWAAYPPPRPTAPRPRSSS